MCGILIESSKEDIIKKEFIELLKNIDNRGRECFGISYLKNEQITTDHFTYRVKNYKENDSSSLGQNVIAHTRYSTSLNKKLNDNIHPLTGFHPILGKYTLIHNGNIPLINYDDGRSDTHFLLEYINNNQHNTFMEILSDLLVEVKLVYCLGLLDSNGNIYVCRDNYGIRPLNIAFYNDKIMICSETTCFTNNYCLKREIRNGEIIHINNNKLIDSKNYNTKTANLCMFEFIYFFNENHIYEDKKLEEIRFNLGYQLAKEETTILNKDDIIVVGMPNTGIPIGKGYANYLNLNYDQIVVKDINCGRSFILPTKEDRFKLLKNNLFYEKDKIKNKIIYIIDDSIVRGNTMQQIIFNFKQYGAKEIHIRIASPPVISPCVYGIDIPDTNQLIAYNKTIEEIKDEFQCLSLNYLNIDKVIKILNNDNLCTGCFTSKYPNKLSW